MIQMKRKELSDDLRGQIVGAYSVGASMTKISEELEVPKTTVWKTINRFKLTGTVAVVPRKGRPCILTDRAARALRRNVLRNRRSSLMQLTKEISEHADEDISTSTFRRELHRM